MRRLPNYFKKQNFTATIFIGNLQAGPNLVSHKNLGYKRRVKNDWVFLTVLTLISVYLSSIYLVLAVENFLECEAAIVRK